MKTPEQLAEEYADHWEQDPEYRLSYDGYLAGYQAAKDQLADADKVIAEDSCEHILDMEKMVDVKSSNNSNGWISVKERLPELNYEVIVAVPFVFEDENGPTDEKGWVIRAAALVSNAEGAKWSIHTEDRWVTYVTHWMPLPEAPKGEG